MIARATVNPPTPESKTPMGALLAIFGAEGEVAGDEAVSDTTQGYSVAEYRGNFTRVLTSKKREQILLQPTKPKIDRVNGFLWIAIWQRFKTFKTLFGYS